MSLHAPARWIVTYDITDARRGGRVHRFMKKHGVPVQYSVFLVEASAAELHQLMLTLEELVNVSQDDVRAYRWPAQPEVYNLGRSILPEGMLIQSQPAAPQRRRVAAVA